MTRWFVALVCVALMCLAFSSEAEERVRCPAWMQSEVCCYNRCIRKHGLGSNSRPWNKCERACLKRHDRATWEEFFGPQKHGGRR
jgi:hypothetical protein